MTSLHRSNEYLAFTKRMRPILRASLPQPCADYHGTCTGIVQPGEQFDVAHLIPLSAGGTNTMANIGVSHRRCNRKAGGSLGGHKTSARNRRRTEKPAW